jgi:hypothetical protein
VSSEEIEIISEGLGDDYARHEVAHVVCNGELITSTIDRVLSFRSRL